MPLEEGQVKVRDLVMGPGTDYIVTHFNPWSTLTRADHSGSNPYADGGWSGPEYLEPVQIPLTVHPDANGTADWQELHWNLRSALRPIRTESVEPEIHWRNGGVDYMMYARPRATDPAVLNMATGDVTTSCSLLALDPHIYSSEEYSVSMGVVELSGGLVTPFTTPFSIYSVVADGEMPVYNGGIEPAWLRLRIDGPATSPVVTVKTPDGPMSLRIDSDVAAGEWLDIDTASKSVLLNGVSSRLNNMSGTWIYIPPRTDNVFIRFNADNSPNAKLTASWRWTY
jgi:hypothetical protein